MKNPTYAQFMKGVEDLISNLGQNELKERITHLAENQSVVERNNFLRLLKQGLPSEFCPDEEKAVPQISPEKLIERIKKLEQRIRDGEFFDEEENWKAYERQEHSHWRRPYGDYYEEEIDFSSEDYVLEAVELLEEAKSFFRKNDTETVYNAYKALFDIFENEEYYDEGCFIYGFSFDLAIDNEVFKEHRTIYLRCLYLKLVRENNPEAIYTILTTEKEILLSDIVEIARTPLPQLDKFIRSFIEYLKAKPEHGKHLVDALFIKGGMEEIKRFAYAYGKSHPPVFLYYYQYARAERALKPELLSLVLDGIKIIPQRYRARATLSLDLIEMAKKKKDKNGLVLGYSTAFYSDPTLKNLTYFLDFIISEKNKNECARLKEYLSHKDVKKLSDYTYTRDISTNELYSLDSAQIDAKTLVIGRYIFEGIEPLLDLVRPKDYLGFSGNLGYVAVIVSLALKSIAQSQPASAIDRLVAHYCFEQTADEMFVLKDLISNKANSFNSSRAYLLKALEKVERLALNRVSHILGEKLRGGYESSCLLLVGCAEAGQILTNNGNELIYRVDQQYKRFSAFRKYLKSLTSMSRHLTTVR